MDALIVVNRHLNELREGAVCRPALHPQGQSQMAAGMQHDTEGAHCGDGGVDGLDHAPNAEEAHLRPGCPRVRQGSLQNTCADGLGGRHATMARMILHLRQGSIPSLYTLITLTTHDRHRSSRKLWRWACHRA